MEEKTPKNQVKLSEDLAKRFSLKTVNPNHVFKGRTIDLRNCGEAELAQLAKAGFPLVVDEELEKERKVLKDRVAEKAKAAHDLEIAEMKAKTAELTEGAKKSAKSSTNK